MIELHGISAQYINYLKGWRNTHAHTKQIIMYIYPAKSESMGL